MILGVPPPVGRGRAAAGSAGAPAIPSAAALPQGSAGLRPPSASLTRRALRFVWARAGWGARRRRAPHSTITSKHSNSNTAPSQARKASRRSSLPPRRRRKARKAGAGPQAGSRHSDRQEAPVRRQACPAPAADLQPETDQAAKRLSGP